MFAYLKMFESSVVHMFANLRSFKCSKVRMFAKIQKLICSDVRMFVCSNVQLYPCSSVRYLRGYYMAIAPIKITNFISKHYVIVVVTQMQ